MPVSYLFREAGDKLLLEDGTPFLLEDSEGPASAEDWTPIDRDTDTWAPTG